MAVQTDYELTQDQAIQFEGANEMLMLTVQELFEVRDEQQLY
ncbi:hypothetical protein NQZ71_22255 (plasmid) [Niallia taxi]|nr:hypothetical protein [Niallia taxi]WOD65890.1 hypothetical protein NQZ71_22255 [Niallia taxi]